MKKYRFEILRDDDGAVRGYKLGNHYLIKHYVWGNEYEWIINKDGKDYYFAYEIMQLHDAGEVEWGFN